jgi:hypothetical protein
MRLAGIQKKSLDARPSLRWGRLFAGMTKWLLDTYFCAAALSQLVRNLYIFYGGGLARE